MMKTTVLALLLGAALLAFGLACGDDGGSLEDYIIGLEALRTSPDREPSLFEEFDVQPRTPVTENEGFMNAAATASAEGTARFEQLEPPSNLKNAHEMLLALASETVAFFVAPNPTVPIDASLRTADALCEIYAAADEGGIEHDFPTSNHCDPDDPSKARRPR